MQVVNFFKSRLTKLDTFIVFSCYFFLRVFDFGFGPLFFLIQSQCEVFAKFKCGRDEGLMRKAKLPFALYLRAPDDMVIHDKQ